MATALASLTLLPRGFRNGSSAVSPFASFSKTGLQVSRSVTTVISEFLPYAGHIYCDYSHFLHLALALHLVDVAENYVVDHAPAHHSANEHCADAHQGIDSHGMLHEPDRIIISGSAIPISICIYVLHYLQSTIGIEKVKKTRHTSIVRAPYDYLSIVVGVNVLRTANRALVPPFLRFKSIVYHLGDKHDSSDSSVPP
jgi:hypothetical protein